MNHPPGLKPFDLGRLIELIVDKAVKHGEFVLASGKKASYYLDCRQISLDGEGANLIAAGMIEAMEDDWPDAVGGLAIGADPITAAIITCTWQRGRPLSGFIVRKEPKQHGMSRLVEGPVQAGQRAVIIEDTVTSGSSCLTAINHCREFGLVVQRVIAVVDRLEGAKERLAGEGIELTSLCTIEDFL